MLNMWTIRAVYQNGGGHTLRDGDRYRFNDKQVAMEKVESLNADAKKNGTETRYVVVPEE